MRERVYIGYIRFRVYFPGWVPMEQLGRSPRQIGAIVRRQRRRQGLSQGQLGSKVQFRQATISNLEVGKAGTRVCTLLDVLAALDLEIVVRPRTKGSTAEIEDLF